MDADAYYKMDHLNRGVCHIFCYEDYENEPKLHRPSADYDAERCSAAFGKIGFKTSTHKNLTTLKLLLALYKVAETDHSDSDALVVVFMGHGGTDEGKEILQTYGYESYIPASDLWQPFAGSNCMTLVWKPKLFFIQACRGEGIDMGVTLQIDRAKKTVKLIKLPNHADLLVMWATYAGMSAFKHGVENQPQASSLKNPTDFKRQAIEGSVFIHFLTKIIEDEGSQHCLSLLLQKVTRRVAQEYDTPEAIDHFPAGSKQIPHLQSTVTKEVFFGQLKKLKTPSEPAHLTSSATTHTDGQPPKGKQATNEKCSDKMMLKSLESKFLEKDRELSEEKTRVKSLEASLEKVRNYFTDQREDIEKIFPKAK